MIMFLKEGALNDQILCAVLTFADVHRAASGVINRGTVSLPWPKETDIQVHTHSARMSQPGLGPRILAALAAPSKPWALKKSAPEVENTESYETTDLYEGALQ